MKHVPPDPWLGKSLDNIATMSRGPVYTTGEARNRRTAALDRPTASPHHGICLNMGPVNGVIPRLAWPQYIPSRLKGMRRRRPGECWHQSYGAVFPGLSVISFTSKGDGTPKTQKKVHVGGSGTCATRTKPRMPLRHAPLTGAGKVLRRSRTCVALWARIGLPPMASRQ